MLSFPTIEMVSSIYSTFCPVHGHLAHAHPSTWHREGSINTDWMLPPLGLEHSWGFPPTLGWDQQHLPITAPGFHNPESCQPPQRHHCQLSQLPHWALATLALLVSRISLSISARKSAGTLTGTHRICGSREYCHLNNVPWLLACVPAMPFHLFRF